MSWQPATPVTGAAVTGLTSPTYTLSADSGVDFNTKQHAVTALGGTQTGVVVSSVAAPFTVSFWRPKQFKQLPPANQVTGARSGRVPMNEYGLNIRKGVLPAANMPYETAMVQVRIRIPAGADTYDQANLKAMLSLLGGILNAEANDIATVVTTGVF